MQGFRARILALVTVLLVGLPLGAAGSNRYFCRAMDRVMESCCCKGKDAGNTKPADSAPQIKAEDCCKLLKAAAPTQTLVLRGDESRASFAFQLTAAPLWVPIIVPEAATWTQGATQAIAARAPPRGPPIYLQNRSLLI